MHLVEARGQLYDPPARLMDDLRRVRPLVDLIYDPLRLVWHLGEVVFNAERYRRAVNAIHANLQLTKQFGEKARDRKLLWEQDLVRQGFSFIKEYPVSDDVWLAIIRGNPLMQMQVGTPGFPNGRILIDYARMCWKEDHGLLETEFFAMAAASDDEEIKRRKIAKAREVIRYNGRQAFHHAMLGRRSVRYGSLARPTVRSAA